jgi:hypothetical protein
MNELLPSVPLPTDSVEIAGVTVRFRSLSRAEALKLTTQFKDNTDGAEDFIIACGTGVSIEEASAWRQSVDTFTAGALIDGIIILTGLIDDPKKD